MPVTSHDALALGPDDVAPGALNDVEQERTDPDVVGEGHPHALVVVVALMENLLRRLPRQRDAEMPDVFESRELGHLVHVGLLSWFRRLTPHGDTLRPPSPGYNRVPDPGPDPGSGPKLPLVRPDRNG